MMRFLDKWGLQALLAIIGLIILYGIFLAPGRVETPTKKGGASAAKKV